MPGSFRFIISSPSYLNHKRLQHKLHPQFSRGRISVGARKQLPGISIQVFDSKVGGTLVPYPMLSAVCYCSATNTQKAPEDSRVTHLDHWPTLSPAHTMGTSFTPRKPLLQSLLDSQCVGTSHDPCPASQVAPSRPLFTEESSQPRPLHVAFHSHPGPQYSQASHPCPHTQSRPSFQVS